MFECQGENGSFAQIVAWFPSSLLLFIDLVAGRCCEFFPEEELVSILGYAEMSMVEVCGW